MPAQLIKVPHGYAALIFKVEEPQPVGYDGQGAPIYDHP